MEKREALYGRLNRYLLILYLAINLGMGVLDIYRGDVFHYMLAFGSLLFIPAIKLFYRLFRLKPVHQLDTIVFAFIFLSYTIGEVMAGYYWIPSFDKVCHGLSGTFTGLLGIIMYYIMKPGRRVERADYAACAVFMLSFAMAIAGLWEIGEYTISLVTDMDPQWVAGTGVTDTMTDMIVCAVGALLLLPSMHVFYRRGRADVLMGAVESFCVLNLGGMSDLER
jgi:hypothetical protein